MSKLELAIDNETLELPDEITLGMYQEMNRFPEKYLKSRFIYVSLL